ncbi:hypothetical protein WA016_02692 [Myxococcus stipitatus]
MQHLGVAPLNPRVLENGATPPCQPSAQPPVLIGCKGGVPPVSGKLSPRLSQTWLNDAAARHSSSCTPSEPTTQDSGLDHGGHRHAHQASAGQLLAQQLPSPGRTTPAPILGRPRKHSHQPLAKPLIYLGPTVVLPPVPKGLPTPFPVAADCAHHRRGRALQCPGDGVARGASPHRRHGHASAIGERAATPGCPPKQRLPLLSLQPLPTFALGQGLLALRFSAHTEPNERCPCSLFPLRSGLLAPLPDRESRLLV